MLPFTTTRADSHQLFNTKYVLQMHHRMRLLGIEVSDVSLGLSVVSGFVVVVHVRDPINNARQGEA